MADVKQQAIVRRFTQDLDGKTTLEKSTKAAQNIQDSQECLAEQLRMQHLFDQSGAPGSPSPVCFSAAEIARDELEKLCDRVADKQKVSWRSRYWYKSRKDSPQVLTEKALRDAAGSQVQDVNRVVMSAQKKWQDSQGKIHTNFLSLCKALDAHKDIFAIFPQYNTYTSVLTSCVSLFIQTAVNHALIADTLSSCLESITSKVALCQKYIQVIKTDEMARRLADVYKSLFQFYREAMEYFLSSSMSKFFKAFNSDLPVKHQSALSAVEEQIVEIGREAQISGLAMQSFELRLLQNMDLRYSRDLAEMVQQNRDLAQQVYAMRRAYESKPIVDPGQAALKFLYAGLQAQKQRENLQASAPDASTSSCALVASAPPRAKQNRRHSLIYFEDLGNFLIGDNGVALLGDRVGNWHASSDVLLSIEMWMNTAESSTLWIETALNMHQEDPARSAAMGVIESISLARINFVSHLCERPRKSPFDGVTPTEAGVLGLVYSLIYQLLQFAVEDDDIDLSKERFDKLSLGIEAWLESLTLLQDLLMGTSNLPFCIIHGLNELERSEGMEMCDEVLQVLFECQRERNGIFKILLTTAGRSRLLSQQDEPISHFLSQSSPRRVRDQGRRIQLSREASSLADYEDEDEELDQ